MMLLMLLRIGSFVTNVVSVGNVSWQIWQQFRQWQKQVISQQFTVISQRQAISYQSPVASSRQMQVDAVVKLRESALTPRRYARRLAPPSALSRPLSTARRGEKMQGYSMSYEQDSRGWDEKGEHLSEHLVTFSGYWC